MTTDRQTHVVVLDHTAALGGAELSLLRLLQHTGGFRVTTILFSEGPLVERLERQGNVVEVLPLSNRLLSVPRQSVGRSFVSIVRIAMATLPFAVRVGRRLRALKPDVIHTTSLKADLIGLLGARIARRPLVWHIHDRIAPDYLPRPAVHLLRYLARHGPTRVIANSRATAATLPGAPVTIAYPGFSAMQSRSLVADVSPTPLQAVVGIIGRISPTKGQWEFVQAAARVLQLYPDTLFRVVGAALFGEEDYAERVRCEAARLGIAESISFEGFVGDPAAVLDDLSLFVHASPTPEPFGQVIVEAMIRGVPVVATRGGGVSEILEPEAGTEALGWLVPPRDVEALSEAICEALGDPQAARARARAAWSSAVERFPVERTAEVISGVWQAAAGR